MSRLHWVLTRVDENSVGTFVGKLVGTFLKLLFVAYCHDPFLSRA